MTCRRNFLSSLLALVAGTAAAAQAWPSRPVRIIVPFAAGSVPDIVARLTGERLQANLGQPVVVENRTGAAGMIGANAVARAEPDGHTIGIGSVGPLINNPLLFDNMPYDPARDLRPITKAVVLPSVLVVRRDFPAGDMEGFVAEVKRHPHRYSYASVGNGSLAHLTMEVIAERKGLALKHLPYAGGPQMMSAILGGHVDMTVMPMQTVRSMVEDGRLKVLAAATASPLLPGLRSFAQQGLGAFDATSWFGFFTAAGVSDQIVDRLQVAIHQVLTDPAVADRLRAQYMEVLADRPDQFLASMRAEGALWKPVIQRLNIAKQ